MYSQAHADCITEYAGEFEVKLASRIPVAFYRCIQGRRSSPYYGIHSETHSRVVTQHASETCITMLSLNPPPPRLLLLVLRSPSHEGKEKPGLEQYEMAFVEMILLSMW